MPVNPPPSSPATVYAALDLVQDAMIEVGLLAPGEPVNEQPDVGQWVFRKLNYLLDQWAADNNFVYTSTFGLFTLQVGLSPHTIGPANATFQTDQRPVVIESAAILLPGTNGQSVDVPIAVEDDDWWSANPVKNLVSSLPTHVYYAEDNPNGLLYYWPIPNIAYQTRLRYWKLLEQFTAITDPVDGPGGTGIIPPGYRNALMLSLAEQIGGEPDATLGSRALTARSKIFGNNETAPKILTKDGGMPSPNHTRPRYNFLTREPY